MRKPVILAVDDEPEVLNAVERDIRHHFHSDYRVMKAQSGREALDTTIQLKKRGTPVALFIADERMPEMRGTDFLAEALKLFPDARRVLLTAYADTETAIAAINRIGLDHYLMKPWEPPSERLYPVLDDLLSEWRAKYRPPFEGVRVAGTAFSGASHEVKEFLACNLVPYQWLDVDQDPTAAALVASISEGPPRLPVVLLPDGTAVIQPTQRELAEKLGMQTQPQRPFYDLAILGGGPAGLAASVYAASEGLRTILVERYAPGGQAGTSSRIENYLGFPSGLSGTDLARRATAQAKRFGTEILTAQEVAGVARKDPYRIVRLTDGTELNCYCLLIASGMEVRRLEIPGVEELNGAGVFYGAALTEAATCRGSHIVIVGGGNSAGQGAMFFSRSARKVTMIVRGESLARTMSQYLVDRIDATNNVEVLTRTAVTAVHGETRLESVGIANLDTSENTTLSASAMFIFIGAAPRTEVVAGFVERDAQGFILTGPDLVANGRRPGGWSPDRDPYFFETSVPGVFAAGDARHGSGKRVASAVGEGAATVSMVHEYLQGV